MSELDKKLADIESLWNYATDYHMPLLAALRKCMAQRDVYIKNFIYDSCTLPDEENREIDYEASVCDAELLAILEGSGNKTEGV